MPAKLPDGQARTEKMQLYLKPSDRDRLEKIARSFWNKPPSIATLAYDLVCEGMRRMESTNIMSDGRTVEEREEWERR